MAQKLEEESAVEEQGNCKGLSWRSRNTSSWWTSAVDLSSTLLSKIDQVPASLVSFTLPWQSSVGGGESKLAPQIEPKPGSQIAEDCEPAAAEEETVENSESNCILKGGDMARGAESRRRTKRMPVDVAKQEDDDDAPIRSKKLSAVSQDFLFGQQGTEEMGRLRRHRRHLSHVDTARIRRLDDVVTGCSSRSWAETNPPRPLPPPPPSADSSPRLPDDYSTLKPIRLQCEDALVLGGSTRVTTRSGCEEFNKVKPTASLPSSPRLKDSRSSKLLRTLGISTTHESPGRSRNNLEVEPRKLALTNGSVPDVKVSKKKSSSRLFKWIWGSSKPKPTSRNPSWGCATSASTAVIISRTLTGNRVESSDSFRDCNGSFRDCHMGSFRGIETPSSSNHGSFRENFEDCHGSFRSMASAEWDLTTTPPSAAADLSLTIGDVAALCNSSLKFVFKCREVQHFNKFLRSRKKRLLSASATGSDCFHVILSGTDPEVSSVVAAMCYAWYLDNVVGKDMGRASRLALPMINFPRDEMRKHKDATWLFDACGIDVAALLFADEVKLASLVRAGRIKFSTIGQDVLVTKNEVGSVCTLLGEKLVAEAKHVLEPRYMKTLLLAGVLLDTENLDFASMRDTEMTNTLLVGCGSLERNAFFDQLRDVEDGYGDSKQQRIEKEEAEQSEQLSDDKESVFTQSQDHTSTSEAGTSSSSVDEDSPRLKPRFFFKFTHSHATTAPATSGCNEPDKVAVAHIRKAATQFVSSSRGAQSSRMRKKPLLYHV